MAEIIKLENLKSSFDRASGKPVIEEITDFVCAACRHLVNQDDKFCWQCGEKLKSSTMIEHYHRGKKLTDKEYKERVAKPYL